MGSGWLEVFLDMVKEPAQMTIIWGSMSYSRPVASVELSDDQYFVCLIDVNGATDMPRQLGGWTVSRTHLGKLTTLLAGCLVAKANDADMEELEQIGIAGFFSPDDARLRAQSEVESLKTLFESVSSSPERSGMGALTEPRWPALDRFDSLPITSGPSGDEVGRKAFVLGADIKNLAEQWGRLETIRLTAAYPLPKGPDVPKGSQRKFRYYLSGHAGPDARPLPVVE